MNLNEQACKWANDSGEVLVLRYINADGTTRGGFVNPVVVGESVTALDWHERAECGGGIHGWPWGLSIGDGKEPIYTSVIWQVYGVRPERIINLGGKCKFQTGVLRYSGDWQGAFEFILSGQIRLVQFCASGAASATGARGAASATGESGAASATGERGAASATGERGAASATGESGAASATGARGAASATGWSGAASATGWSGAASATGARGAASATGACSSAVCTDIGGKVRGGERGVIALAWWNPRTNQAEMRAALIGKGRRKLKSNVWYTLDEHGHFVEVRG
jgi:hypothetical protein